jgi:expansin (peptidoglycan-binding protein)
MQLVLAIAGLLAISVTAYTGDMTYYDPNGGVGACGEALSNSDVLVALGPKHFGSEANPNHDEVCGKSIKVTYQGKSAAARVADKCPTCSGDSIDVTEPVFSQLSSLNVGRVGVDWVFN